jgi:glycine cleavage system aminomethyltransferase T
VARGPLVEVHHAAGATLEIVNGWEVAVRYPGETPNTASGGSNAIVDLSHWVAYEVNGPDVDATLRSIVGEDVTLRRIVVKKELSAYRLTKRRAVVFEFGSTATTVFDPEAQTRRGGGRYENVVDVTGGWASIVLYGPDSLNILNKVTAVDLREETLPMHACCQGPIFGVNTLFGRFDHGFELHVCPDSMEFLWEVLLDAGAEFGLKPAGIEQFKVK